MVANGCGEYRYLPPRWQRLVDSFIVGQLIYDDAVCYMEHIPRAEDPFPVCRIVSPKNDDVMTGLQADAPAVGRIGGRQWKSVEDHGPASRLEDYWKWRARSGCG